MKMYGVTLHVYEELERGQLQVLVEAADKSACSSSPGCVLAARYPLKTHAVDNCRSPASQIQDDVATVDSKSGRWQGGQGAACSQSPFAFEPLSHVQYLHVSHMQIQ
jgi:hypothetical protein